MKLKNIFAIILLFIFSINTSGATFFKASTSLKIHNTKENKLENYWELTENEQIAAGIKIKLWDNDEIVNKKEITQEKLTPNSGHWLGESTTDFFDITAKVPSRIIDAFYKDESKQIAVDYVLTVYLKLASN